MKRLSRFLPLFLSTVACAGPAATSASAGAVQASAPPLQDGFALVHGLKMHYLRQGKGPTLVFLHGGLGSASEWSKAMPFFATQFDVIAPDQLGQGATPDNPAHAMSYDAMAEDTVALLGQLGVTKAILAGQSDGAILALDIAMHHPELAQQVVANSANYDLSSLTPPVLEFLKGLKPSDPLLADPREQYGRLSPDGLAHWPIVFERIRKLWLSQPTWTAKDLAKIKAPTLIFAGDRDLVPTIHTVQLASAIPGAELEIVPNADHGLAVSDPSRWNAVVMRFLTEPPPPPAAK